MKRHAAVSLIVCVVLGTMETADAQWVFLARTALGAIKHLVSDGKETATVIIEGKAPNVYADAIALVQRQGTQRICGELGVQCSVSKD